MSVEMTGKAAGAVRGSSEGMFRQLEDELREYDEVKSGEFTERYAPSRRLALSHRI
jgi:hypothetical protein